VPLWGEATQRERARRAAREQSGLEMMGHGTLQVFALLRTDEVRDQLAQAIDGAISFKTKIRVGQLSVLGASGIYAENADILLLDVDAEEGADMDVLNQLRIDAAVTHAPILVTSGKLSTTGMRRLLRDGVDDYLPQPLAAEDVVEAMETAVKKLRRRHAATGLRGRILTFAKAAGGMGATSLAVNVASCLTQLRRKQRTSVCLIDLDLQFGASALYLDLDKTAGLVEIARSPERLDADLLRGSTIQHGSGLNVLTAPSRLMPLEALKPELLESLLDLARQEFEYIVLDLPHALTSWTDTVLTRSDLVFLVTQLNVPATRQARRLLDVLQEEGLYNLPLKVVLNRYQWSFGRSAQVSLRQAEKSPGPAGGLLHPQRLRNGPRGPEPRRAHPGRQTPQQVRQEGQGDGRALG
jgi:pilus assembly protein CpaE